MNKDNWYKPVKISPPEKDPNVLRALGIRPVYTMAAKLCRVIIARQQPENLDRYGADAVMVSVHAVARDFDHKKIINQYAADRRCKNSFYLQFNAICVDVFEERDQKGRRSVINGRFISPVYNAPVSFTAQGNKSVLKLSASALILLFHESGVPWRLKGGRGEPLHKPEDLIIHSASTPLNPREPQKIGLERPKPLVVEV